MSGGLEAQPPAGSRGRAPGLFDGSSLTQVGISGDFRQELGSKVLQNRAMVAPFATSHPSRIRPLALLRNRGSVRPVTTPFCWANDRRSEGPPWKPLNRQALHLLLTKERKRLTVGRGWPQMRRRQGDMTDRYPKLLCLIGYSCPFFSAVICGHP
jgi:hypothetical protein